MKKFLKTLFHGLGLEVSRYHKRQKSKRSNDLTLYKTVTGNYYLPSKAYQDLIANAIKNNQIFDIEIFEVAKKYIKPGTTVLDVGSNFGQMAILMSKLAGEKGVVHAFDADDFVYGILEKNIKENATNIIPHYGAVHDKGNDTLFFPVQDFERFGSYGSYGIDYVNNKGRAVKTIKIDDIHFDLPVSFMKIDVQGGDLFALKGAVQTIAKNKMPIIFEYEYLFEEELNLCFQDYVDFVHSINYKFHKVINGQNFLIIPV
jgi:FkbM family methyltransferase